MRWHGYFLVLWFAIVIAAPLACNGDDNDNDNDDLTVNCFGHKASGSNNSCYLKLSYCTDENTYKVECTGEKCICQVGTEVEREFTNDAFCTTSGSEKIELMNQECDWNLTE